MAKRFKCSPHLSGQAHAFPAADAAEPELRVVVFIVVVVVVEPQPTADAKEEADHQRRRGGDVREDEVRERLSSDADVRGRRKSCRNRNV